MKIFSRIFRAGTKETLVMPDRKKEKDITHSGTSRIDVGSCFSCGRILRVKPGGLQKRIRLTCKCGQVNLIKIDQDILLAHGIIRTSVETNIYHIGSTPLYHLLDGPCLRAAWAASDAMHANRWNDLPPGVKVPENPSEIISVSVNPYVSEQNARRAMRILVDRIRTMDKARPWSVELFKNVECAVIGMLPTPYFVIVGVTEISCSGDDTYNAIKQITSNLRSDSSEVGGGGEWELWSQNQGNRWRADQCAILLERWVFLDVDSVETFGVKRGTEGSGTAGTEGSDLESRK